MEDLANKKCVTYEGGTLPIKGDKINPYLEQVKYWKVIDEHHIVKRFKFPDFVKALELVNKVAEIAEKEGHHPNITFTLGKVEIKLYTHTIDGLSENDFILARKIDLIK